MKIETKGGGDRSERDALPWDLRLPKEPNLKTLRACGDIEIAELRKIEKMDLVDMGNVEDRKEVAQADFCASFFKGFSNGTLRGGFLNLHEPGRKCPQAESGFDCSATEQYLILPGRNRSEHNLGVHVMDCCAGLADGPLSGITLWDSNFVCTAA